MPDGESSPERNMMKQNFAPHLQIVHTEEERLENEIQQYLRILKQECTEDQFSLILQIVDNCRRQRMILLEQMNLLDELTKES